MNILTEDIKDMIEADSSLALSFEEELFIGFEPSNPDDVITLFDTGGFPPQLTMDRTSWYFYDSFQIRVRNIDYNIGMAKAYSLMESLHGRGHETWSGMVYELVRCVNGPSYMGKDLVGRMIFVLNFEVQRREA